jgi:paraquat-inducible protein B
LNNNQKILGSVVTTLILVFVAYFLFFAPEEGVHIIVEAENAAGLEQDNLVVTGGIQVGVVHKMQLKKDFSGKIIIDLRLTITEFSVPKDGVYAVITDADLMGTKQLELVFKTNNCNENCLEAYDTIYSSLGSYFDDEINDLAPLMALITDTYETLDTVIKSWKQENFGNYDTKIRKAERQIKEMTNNFIMATDKSIALVEKSTNSYNRISEQIIPIYETLQGEEVVLIQENIETITTNFESVDFEKTTALAQNAVKDWNVTLENIEVTKEILGAILKKLEADSDGTLAKMLNDPRFKSEGTTDYAKLLEDIRLNPSDYTYLLGF